MESIIFFTALITFIYLLSLGTKIQKIADDLEVIKRSESKTDRTLPAGASPVTPSVPTAHTPSPVQQTVSPEQSAVQPAPAKSAPVAPPVTAAAPRVVQQQTYSNEPNVIEKLFAWVKKDWLAKAGSLILLLGVGGFVSYAFSEGWVDAWGRIAVGLVTGVSVLAFGYFRIKKYSNQGSMFLVLGSTIILLTLWAARAVYDFFDPIIALTIMSLSIAFVFGIAVKYLYRHLAIVSLVLAFIAPLLTGTPEPSFLSFFSYLLIVVAGTSWVVVRTGWSLLFPISLTFLFFYSLPFVYDVADDEVVISLFFTFVFATLFTLVLCRSYMKERQPVTPMDGGTIGAMGLYTLIWVSAAAPQEWEGFIYTVLASIVIAIGYSAYRMLKNTTLFYLYSGIGLTYIVLATVSLFDGSILTIVFALEALLAAVMGYLITGNKKLLVYLSWLLVVPLLCSIGSVVSTLWYYGVPLDDLAVLMVLMAVFAGMGAFMYRIETPTGESALKNWMLIHGALGALYFLTIIWLVSHGLFAENYDIGTLISLVTYTVLGVGVYVIGHMRNNSIIRFAGGLLAGLVIARLLLVEVWEMDMAVRIATFLIVGVLMVATAFLERAKGEEPQDSIEA